MCALGGRRAYSERVSVRTHIKLCHSLSRVAAPICYKELLEITEVSL